jgi:hypothetical protein
MFQPKRFPMVKTIAIVGAIALLLVPTYALIREDLAEAKYLKTPIAVFYVNAGEDSGLMVVTGDGKIHTLSNPTDEQVDAIGKSVAHGSAVEIDVPAAAPSQQTYNQP